MGEFECPACGSKKFGDFLKGGRDLEYQVSGQFNLVKCSLCGLTSLFPVPTEKQLLTYYPDSYHCYNTSSSKITRWLTNLSLRKEAKLFQELIGNKGKILDVGCSDGKQFDYLRKFGDWQFVGIDFNQRIIKKGKVEGRGVYTATLENFKYKRGSFDIIVMDHLLEHVSEPNLTLRSAARFLKKGGYVIGGTPNVDSFEAKISGIFWGGYHFPRHVYLFNPETLMKLFRRNSFEVKNISYELHTGHLALSVQNYFQNRAWSRVHLKQGRAFYYPFLLIFFIPLSMVQKMFKKTGVISFIVQKGEQ